MTQPEHDRILILDFGSQVTQLIARRVREAGAYCEIHPFNRDPAQIAAFGAKGVILSGGPCSAIEAGSPQAPQIVFELGVPVLGICLGHQLLGLALGARTFKLKFGHHGGNQPVRRVDTGRVLITSQNHGFAVDPDSLPDGVVATEFNLNDGTLEAFAVLGKPVVSAQYHPEAAPGPNDADPLFTDFYKMVEKRKAGKI